MEPRELTEMLSRRLAIGSVCLLFGAEATQMEAFDARSPFLIWQLQDTLKTEPIIALHTDVRIVVRSGRRPQIIPSIIRRIAILMVDLVSRPFARHIEKGEARALVKMSVDADHSIAVLLHGARQLACSATAPPRIGRVPMPFARSRVVGQHLAQAFNGDHDVW